MDADGDGGPDIGALLDAGRALFQSGRLAEAAGALATVLETDPDHLDALYLLGAVAYHGKVFPLAVECLGKALTLGPPVPQAFFGLAAALEGLGRLEEAALHYSNALRVQPIFPEAAANLGLVLYRLGRLEEGIDCLRDAARQQPDDALVLNNLGLMLFETGRPDEAVEQYTAALRLNPALPEALTNLGSLLLKRGRRDDALALQKAAVCLQPAFPSALSNLAGSLMEDGRAEGALAFFLRAHRVDPSFGSGDWHAGLAAALEGLGRLEEAALHYGEALRVQPVFPEALAGLGLVLYHLGRQDEGIGRLREAVRQRPDDALALNNLGLMLLETGRADEAAEHYATALRLDPALPEVLTNLGRTFMESGRPEDALRWFLRVLRIDPAFGGGDLNEALARLELGDLASGWDKYERRWLDPGTSRYRHTQGLIQGRSFRQPQWDGVSDIAGKRLLLWREQGVGDEVLFASCFPDLEGLGAHITYEGSPKLRSLFQRSFPHMRVVVEDSTADPTRADFDVHLPIGSLPRLFRRTLADFPDRRGYLRPDPARVVHWRERLRALGPGPYVGLTWSGGARLQTRGHLYSRIEDWEPVLRLPGLTVVNMQYKDATAELAEARETLGIDIHSFADIDMWNDLDEVAALLGALDAQLAVPTAVHQLAGAVGVPTWLALVRRVGWACLGTDRMPWYPAMRVATREPGQPWRAAIARIAAELAALPPGFTGGAQWK